MLALRFLLVLRLDLRPLLRAVKARMELLPALAKREPTLPTVFTVLPAILPAVRLTLRTELPVAPITALTG